MKEKDIDRRFVHKKDRKRFVKILARSDLLRLPRKRSWSKQRSDRCRRDSKLVSLRRNVVLCMQMHHHHEKKEHLPTKVDARKIVRQIYGKGVLTRFLLHFLLISGARF